MHRGIGTTVSVKESAFDANYNPNIIPKYWTGKVPDTIKFENFTIDCGGDITKLNLNDLEKQMKETFEREQLVYLSNTGVKNMS